jgi:putative Mg2+ transporter-C (MgtC) family protein
MLIWLADPLFGGAVQNGRHLIEVFSAFGLTALIAWNARSRARSRGYGPRPSSELHRP